MDKIQTEPAIKGVKLIDSSNFSYDSHYLEQIRLQYPEFPKLETHTNIVYSQEIYEIFANKYNPFNLGSIINKFESGKSNFYAENLESDKENLQELIDLLQNVKIIPDHVRAYLNKLTSYDLNELIEFFENDEYDQDKALQIKKDYIAKVEQITQILRVK